MVGFPHVKIVTKIHGNRSDILTVGGLDATPSGVSQRAHDLVVQNWCAANGSSAPESRQEETRAFMAEFIALAGYRRWYASNTLDT
jgi:hypothetical protein